MWHLEQESVEIKSISLKIKKSYYHSKFWCWPRGCKFWRCRRFIDWIIYICCLQRSSTFACVYCNHTIKRWINSLVLKWPTFFDGIVLSTPTTGNPDVCKLYTQPSATPTSTCHSCALFDRHFKTVHVFFVPVVRCVPVFVLAASL